MDLHFREASFDKNIPVVLALVSVWYNNFYKAETEAITLACKNLTDMLVPAALPVPKKSNPSVRCGVENLGYLVIR